MAIKQLIGVCALAGLVAGCASPHPRYPRASAKKLEVNGYTFTVYSNGRRAQAIRTGFVARPHVALIVPAGMMAIERATGCKILRDRAAGDTNVIEAQIDCG